MGAPASPIYLPGGEAMVRTVGGALSFVTDADECCCGSVPADECPSLEWLTANCPQNLSVTLKFLCYETPCADTFTLTLLEILPARWESSYHGGNIYADCHVKLFCTLEDTVEYPHTIMWFLQAGLWNWIGNDWAVGQCCQWHRPVYVGDCPPGEFTAMDVDPDCAGCDNSVAVSAAS